MPSRNNQRACSVKRAKQGKRNQLAAPHAAELEPGDAPQVRTGLAPSGGVWKGAGYCQAKDQVAAPGLANAAHSESRSSVHAAIPRGTVIGALEQSASDINGLIDSVYGLDPVARAHANLRLLGRSTDGQDGSPSPDSAPSAGCFVAAPVPHDNVPSREWAATQPQTPPVRAQWGGSHGGRGLPPFFDLPYHAVEWIEEDHEGGIFGGSTTKWCHSVHVFESEEDADHWRAAAMAGQLAGYQNCQCGPVEWIVHRVWRCTATYADQAGGMLSCIAAHIGGVQGLGTLVGGAIAYVTPGGRWVFFGATAAEVAAYAALCSQCAAWAVKLQVVYIVRCRCRC
jgi:hypothetical protein